jgi:spermidine synthase
MTDSPPDRANSHRPPPNRWLGVVVAVGGASSLGTEMACARLLAPYFGTSNVVWANVIGLILIYLSLGYWLGGRWADRHPHRRALSLVILVAAVSIAVLPFVTRPLFSVASRSFTDIEVGVYIGSFAATLLTFAIPVTALGAISPWAIRLAVSSVEQAGSVAGRLYALSTVGSIIGTFVSVLVLIPAIGTRRTLLVFALALALVAAPGLPKRAWLVPVAVAALFAAPTGSVRSVNNARVKQVLFEEESAYQYIQVVEQRDGDRVLYLNEGWARHSVLPADGVLTGGYWDAFLTLPLMAQRPAGRLAVLGNAGGTIGNLFAAVWPAVKTDGVEIDPVVTKAARRYLGMTAPQIQVHTADARPWLAATDDRFDYIVADAYRQPYVPFHLATVEFFDTVRDRLTDGGVVAINVGTPPGETEIVDRISATMARVFPAVVGIRYDEFNSILVGFRDSVPLSVVQQRLTGVEGLASASARIMAAGLGPVNVSGGVLTDDHAPIEWLTDKALLAYLRAGAPGAEK